MTFTRARSCSFVRSSVISLLLLPSVNSHFRLIYVHIEPRVMIPWTVLRHSIDVSFTTIKLLTRTGTCTSSQTLHYYILLLSTPFKIHCKISGSRENISAKLPLSNYSVHCNLIPYIPTVMFYSRRALLSQANRHVTLPSNSELVCGYW